MSSAYSPQWKRFLYKVTPFLFIDCLEGNKHWRWDTRCFCVDGSYRPFHYFKGRWKELCSHRQNPITFCLLHGTGTCNCIEPLSKPKEVTEENLGDIILDAIERDIGAYTLAAHLLTKYTIKEKV